MVNSQRTARPASSDEESSGIGSPLSHSKFTTKSLEHLNSRAGEDITCNIKDLLETIIREKASLEDQVKRQKAEIKLKADEIELMKNLNEELAKQNEDLSGKFSEVALDDNRTVLLKRGPGKLFGLSTAGTSITKVREGSPADVQEIERGDQIISIDGVNVETFSHKKIVKMIHDASESCTFVIRHNFERLRDVETDWIVEDKCDKSDQKTQRIRTKKAGHVSSDVAAKPTQNIDSEPTKGRMSTSPVLEIPQPDRVVTIRSGDDGKFGLDRIGTSISGVRKGSSAENQGVKRGDQIISINEIVVEHLYIDIVAHQFERARSTGRIRLTLRYNPERLQHLEMALEC